MKRLFAIGLYLGTACTAVSDERAGTTVQDSGARRSNPTPHAAQIAALERDIEQRRQELRVPGAAVVVVSASDVLLQRGFGLRDVLGAKPVTPTTIFALGSCTKPFTSLAIGIATDRKLLSYEHSPRDFIPWFVLRDSVANARATLRDLLSHRTGVKMDDAQGWYERYPTTQDLIRFAMRHEPAKPFREAFQYNNFMYVVAGEALAIARGVPFADVMEDDIFAPLGMRSTSIRVRDLAQAEEVSLGYTGRSGATSRQPVDPRQFRYLDGITAAGGIFTTASDMSRWMRMMVGGGELEGRRLVSDSSFAAMLVPAVATGGRHYALGWFVEEWHGHTLYSHPGGVTGFGARCEFAPSLNLGWVVLTNVDDGALATSVREMIHRHIVSPVTDPQPSR